MNITPLCFVSLGFGNVICANQIFAVSRLNTAQGRRIIASAKAENRFLDWTAHRPVKSLVITMDGRVIGSPFTVGTIHKRLTNSCTAGFADGEYKVAKEEEYRDDDCDDEEFILPPEE